jgi:hypothetical protein
MSHRTAVAAAPLDLATRRAMGGDSSRRERLLAAPVVASTAGLSLARVASWPGG